MVDLERKSTRLEVKDIDTKQGVFTGYFSSFGTVDSYNDVVDQGAFIKTFKEWGPNGKQRIKCAYQHDPFGALLGKPLILEERSFGAYHESKVSQTSYGKDVLLLIEDGVLTEQSFAFETIQAIAANKSPDGHRHLTELRVYEYGPVTYGANENTPITGVKASDLMGRMAKLDKHLKAGDLADSNLIALMTQTMDMWSKAIGSLQPERAEPEVIEVRTSSEKKSPGEMGEGPVDDQAIMARCMQVLADCVAMAPKCVGSQEMTNQLIALLAQALSLCAQCQAMESESDDLAGEGAGNEPCGLSYEEKIDAIYRAVRMIERIPYTSGDGDYARYWLARTYDAHCIVEDGKTGKYFMAPWTMGTDGVVLGELTEVVMSWTSAQKAASVAMLMRSHMMTGTTALEQKAGARNSGQDAAVIRDIHKKARSLMEKPHQCKAIADDLGEMTADDLNVIMSSLDESQRALVLAACQPETEPGKSHSSSTTNSGTAKGPAEDHPEVSQSHKRASRQRELELMELEL